MNKSSILNARHPSLAKTSSGHAHCSRIPDPLHKLLLFSTPLLGRRGLNVPARRPGDNAMELHSRFYSKRGTLERSFSLNVKTRLNVAASYGRVNSTDLRKSSCLLANSSADPVARYNVRSSSLCTMHGYLIARC